MQGKCKILVVLGTGAQRDIAENELLKLSLSMGEEHARNSSGKCRILVFLGAQAPREAAENEIKLSLSMGEENEGNTQENQGFWWSWGLSHRAESQKMSLS